MEPPGVTSDGVMISVRSRPATRPCEQPVRIAASRHLQPFRGVCCLTSRLSHEARVLTFLLAVIGGTPQGSTTPAPPPAPSRQATAARAVRPPVIDGRDDDEVWRTAQPI